jgi:hypothetical protein
MDRENDTCYQAYQDSCSGVYPDSEFEGLHVEHWPNGQLKYRGEFRKGRMRVGQHICFWENGVLQEVGSWDEGWVCGTLMRFNADGSRDCETDFGADGGRTRSWIERSYGARSRAPWHVILQKNGELVHEWIEAELRDVYGTIDADKIIEEALKQFFPEYRKP